MAERRYVKETETAVVLSDAETIDLARQKMQEELATRLNGGEPVSIRTEGAFSDGGYTLRTRLECVREIGRYVPFAP